MKQRLSELRPQNSSSQSAPGHSDLVTSGVAALSSDSERDEEEEPPAAAESERQTVPEPRKEQPEPRPLQPEPRPLQPEPRPLRRRWSRDSERDLMVQSMFDLRDLDSSDAEVQPRTSEDNPAPHGRDQSQPEPGLKRTNQELGSTVSLQVPDTRANHRPDFIQLANQSPEREAPVLYPDQWEDRVSLAGHEFVVQEVGGRGDKPSPDSGCSLGFSRRSSPDRPTDSERLSADGNSSDLDEEEEEGPVAERGVVPQTPDQEAFLKEHFGTLGQVSPKGSPSRASHSSSESLSISSRFLSHSSAHSRPALPLASRSDGKTPLVSEVRPLRLNQEEPQTPPPQTPPPQTPNLGLSSDPKQERPLEGGAPVAPVAPQARTEAAAEQTAPPRAALFKKKVPEMRRSPGPRGQGPSLSLGLRKSQSVTSLLQDNADPAPSGPDPAPSAPVTPVTAVRPSTLPCTPRRPLPAAARSYMSPTAASKAKVSRSVSIGDGLNDPDLSPLTSPPHPLTVAAVTVPVLVAPPPSAGGRSLQNRVQNKPLPDKPFSPTPVCKTTPTVNTPPTTPAPPNPTPTPESHAPWSVRGTGEAGGAGPAGGVEPAAEEEELSVEACEVLTNELQSVFSRATHLYRKLGVASAAGPAPEQRHMISVLSECFQSLRAELEGLPLGIVGQEGAGMEGTRTAAILEEYSLLLLQAVTRRLQSPSTANTTASTTASTTANTLSTADTPGT